MTGRDTQFALLLDLKSSQARVEERQIAMLERLHSIEAKADIGVRANDRLTKHENRLLGWIVGIGGTSATAGVVLSDAIKNIFKGIGS
jgi:hypothetical protein